MGAQRTSFDKRERDRAKKAKAAAKRERRQDKSSEPGPVEEAPALPPLNDGGGELSAEDLLQRIEAIHKRFDAEEISFEDFEEERAALLARLPIE